MSDWVKTGSSVLHRLEKAKPMSNNTDKLVERAMQQALVVAQRTTAKHLSPLSHDMKKLADITLELATALQAAESNNSTLEACTREKLADYAHTAWSGWMQYMFGKSVLNGDGTMTIPRWAVDRWDMQSKTNYPDLPEEMKLSDRDEADKMLAIVGQSIPKAKLLEWANN